MNKIEVVKKVLDKFPSPASGMIVDLVSYDDTDPSVYLRFYRDNFDNLPDSVRQDVASEWLPTIIGLCSQIGVVVYIEAKDYVPDWKGR